MINSSNNPEEPPRFEVGDKKNVHWHCVIKCKPMNRCRNGCEMVRVPEWQVDVPKDGASGLIKSNT